MLSSVLKIYLPNTVKRGVLMKSNMGLIFGAVASVVAIGICGAMLSNTKAARRRRMVKKAIKTVHNVGCAMQKMTAF
jgi:hypothetical protein